MRVALVIDREMFNKYANWNDVGWELTFVKQGPSAMEDIISTDSDVIVVGGGLKVGSDIIGRMPNLKLIHSQAVAYNTIDLDSTRMSGIYVCNCAGVNARAVAEQALLLLLAVVKNFRWAEDIVYSAGRPGAMKEFIMSGIPELGTLSVGIVGFGAIGRELAALLKPFDCRINYYDSLGDLGIEGYTFMQPEELYSNSDVISLHVPVTPDSKNMINRETLKLFKRGAILINTARGDLMDHSAVVEALISGQLGGLCADTLSPEPVTADNPILRDMPKELRRYVALSPHLGGMSAASFMRSFERIRMNIEALDNGQRLECIVNGL